MGGIISTVVSIVSNIKAGSDADKKAEERRKLMGYTDPTEPPKFYSTIASREKNLKEGPYTVEAIRESLSKNIMPVGYSEETLTKVGFEKEVNEYIKNKKKIRDDARQDLKKYFLFLKNNIEKDFPELSESDKKAIQRSGILDKRRKAETLQYLDNWTKDIDKGFLSDETLNNMVSIANARLGLFQDAIGYEKSKEALSKSLDAARKTRDDQTLKVLRRNLKAQGYITSIRS